MGGPAVEGTVVVQVAGSEAVDLEAAAMAAVAAALMGGVRTNQSCHQ